MSTDEIDGEVIGRQLQTAEQMPAGIMLLKMENETMMSAARVAPRDPEIIIGKLAKYLDLYPAAAGEAVYAKPVGSVMEFACAEERCRIVYEAADERNASCPVCGSERKIPKGRRQKYAEGLSIRAAESIRSEYGYNRLQIDMEMLPDGKVILSGTFVDYAAGSMTSDQRVVSPFYTGRDKIVKRTPEDRFLNVVVKAEKAKLRRDLILDSIPGVIKAMYRDKCDEIAGALVPDQIIEQKIIPAFQKFGLTLGHLERIVGKTKSQGWTGDDNKLLVGILNGLKSGENTVAELLRDITPPAPGSASDPHRAATGDVLKDIVKAKKAGKSADVDVAPKTAQNDPEPAKTPENDATSTGAQSEAPDEPQDAPETQDAPAVEPYAGDERDDVLDRYKREIERALNSKQLHKTAGKIHDDQRLSESDHADLLDTLSQRGDEIDAQAKN